MSPGRLIQTDASGAIVGIRNESVVIEDCSSDHDDTTKLKYYPQRLQLPLPVNPKMSNSINEDNSPQSLRSTHISVVSLDEDDEDSSSIADSDSDLDEIPTKATDFIIDSIGGISGNSVHKNGLPNGANGLIVINNSSKQLAESGENPVKPNIGSIAVQNSSDITFGNKTFYQGPVTIKQFLLEKNQWKQRDQTGGTANGGFDGSSGDINRTNKEDVTKPSEKEQNWYKRLLLDRRPIMVTSIVAVIILLVGTATLTTYFLMEDKDRNEPGDGDDSRKNIPIDSSIGTDITGYGTSLRFVSRSQWLAQPPEGNLSNLELPAKRVIIAHTATEDCLTQASCTFRVRYIQQFHIESNGWDDIGYNFLVGGDGAVYEGRGWDKEGAHTRGYNKRSICIAFIGTFNKVIPTQRQIKAAQLLIEQGIKDNKLDPNYKLHGHRQLIPSESPGLALYEIIKKWPHWSEVPDNYR